MDRVSTPRLSAEELANSLTRGVGLLPSVAGLAALVILAAMRGSAWQIVSCTMYGSTLLCLYGVSTFYPQRSLPPAEADPQGLRPFRNLSLNRRDLHTLPLLVNLRGAWGWSLFAVVWGLAFAGILFKIWLTGRFSALSTGVYLLMGWLALVAIKPMLLNIPRNGLLWLLAGGVLHSLAQYRVSGCS